MISELDKLERKINRLQKQHREISEKLHTERQQREKLQRQEEAEQHRWEDWYEISNKEPLTNIKLVKAWLNPLLLIQSSGNCAVVQRFYEEYEIDFETMEASEDLFYLGVLAIFTASCAAKYNLDSLHKQSFAPVYECMQHHADFWPLAKVPNSAERKLACLLWKQQCFGNEKNGDHIFSLLIPERLWNLDLTIKDSYHVLYNGFRKMTHQPRTKALKKWASDTYETTDLGLFPAPQQIWYANKARRGELRHANMLKVLSARIRLNRTTFYRSLPDRTIFHQPKQIIE